MSEHETIWPLRDVLEDRTWAHYAVCGSKSELFFAPNRERPGKRMVRERAAKLICATCPVAVACRDSGRRNHEVGIWGGETEEERARAGFPIRTFISRRILDAGRENPPANVSDCELDSVAG